MSFWLPSKAFGLYKMPFPDPSPKRFHSEASNCLGTPFYTDLTPPFVFFFFSQMGLLFKFFLFIPFPRVLLPSSLRIIGIFVGELIFWWVSGCPARPLASIKWLDFPWPKPPKRFHSEASNYLGTPFYTDLTPPFGIFFIPFPDGLAF